MDHVPVLLREIIELLDPKPGEFFIDGTINGGGHAAEIARHIGNSGTLLGIDWDESLIMKAKERFRDVKNIALVHGNYADLPIIFRKKKLPKADGVLLDLGFSSEQIGAEAGRGFSFLRDEPLLMTYDHSRTPVKTILKGIREDELAEVIRSFGGERYARRVAQAIVRERRLKPIETSGALAEVIRRALPRGYERGRIDPATRTFQALRIFANGELENLQRFLDALPLILAPGGRVAVVSFHDLEDRIVKQSFRRQEREGTMKIFTKKPVVASEAERKENPRSRSAKLRTAIFLEREEK